MQAEGNIYWMARGYEDRCITEKTDPPTCKKNNLRLLTISASKRWGINSLDIQCVLQGEKPDRNILCPPVEANTTKLWHLRKCVYGLKMASRKWYDRVSKELDHLDVNM